MNFAKTLFKDSIVYGVSKYLGVLAALFLTPIYTRILTKADYGAMDIYNVWIGLLAMLLPLGTLNAVLRFYPDLKHNSIDRKRFIGNILGIILCVGAVFLGIAVTLKDHFMTSFFDSALGYSNIYFIFMCIVVLSILFDFHLQLLRIQFRKYHYLILSLVNFVIVSGGGFSLVYFFQMGIIGFFYASLTGLLVACLLGFWFNRNEFDLQLNKADTSKIFKYSIHFVSASLLFQLTLLVDRYIITDFIDLSTTGIYSISNRLAGLLNFVISAFSMAWMPYLFKKAEDEGTKRLVVLVYKVYLGGSTLFLIGLVLFGGEIIRVMAPGYYDSYYPAIVLALFYVINGLMYVFTVGLHLTKRTGVITWSAAIAVVVNIVSSVLLLKEIGLIGVAIGSVLSALVWIVIQHVFSQRYKSFNYPYYWLLLPLVGFVLSIGLIGLMSPELNKFVKYLIKFGVLSFVAGFFFVVLRGQFSK